MFVQRMGKLTDYRVGRPDTNNTFAERVGKNYGLLHTYIIQRLGTNQNNYYISFADTVFERTRWIF
jgi:hypothetical protein